MFKRIQDWLSNAETDLAVDARHPSQSLDTAMETIAGDGVSDDVRALWRSNIQGRFQPIRELGRGGTSSVHDAADLSLERYTALKVLHAELAAKPSAVAQFIVEAQVTAQLEHPNIIPVYEFGQDAEGVPYINMRKVAGRTFERYLDTEASQRLDPANLREALGVLLRVCDALAYAHSRGVVHRDVKPANIMVGEFGEVYLMDWGIAITDATPAAVNPVLINAPGAPGGEPRSSLAGTPAYMAPEQTTGLASDISPQTDVFLLGATLYHLLCGVPPYAHGSSMKEVMAMVGVCEYRPVNSLTGKRRAPPGLIEIAKLAMHAAPEARFKSVLEFKHALDAFLQGTGHLGMVRYAAGENIVHEGEPGDRAFIVTAGVCEVYTMSSGERQVLREIGIGGVFGEMAILSGGIRTSSVDAKTEVELEVVTRESLTDSLGIKTWAGRFVTALAERFIELEQHTRDQSQR